MGKKVQSTQTQNVRREADANVAKVMGKGLYWLVVGVVYVPVKIVESAAKAVGIIKKE